MRLFAAVIDKASCKPEDDLTKLLFEQATSRFDHFLNRINCKKGRTLKEKGILIVDRAKKELEVQRFALGFKHQGYTWGKLKNMAEVPLFLDSKSSRLIQLADLIAFAIYRYFQYGDALYYNTLGTISIVIEDIATVCGLSSKSANKERLCVSGKTGIC